MQTLESSNVRAGFLCQTRVTELYPGKMANSQCDRSPYQRTTSCDDQIRQGKWRKCKSIGQSIYIDGKHKAGSGSMDNYTVYASPYLLRSGAAYLYSQEKAKLMLKI